MCRAFGVNRTGFHNWERRAPSDRALQDAWLTEKIKQIHDASRGVYGAPRIHAELRMEHNIRVGRKRVARLMKAAGISGVRPRKRWKTTIRIPGITPASDLVERQFRPASPNVVWVADITYLRTGEGLAVPRRGTGRLLAPDRRLVDGHAHALDTGRRRAQDGARPPAPRARTDPSLRPGLAVRESRVRPRRKAGRDRGLDGVPRGRLRQRGRRDVSSPRSRRSSSTAAAGRGGSSSSRRCSSTSRRSTTAGAATPRSGWSPRLSTSRPRQRRHQSRSNNQRPKQPGCRPKRGRSNARALASRRKEKQVSRINRARAA